MNLNEAVINPNRAQGRGRSMKNAINRRNPFVATQLNKKQNKSSTSSSSTWGAQKNSVYNSTILNTGSSSKTTTTSADDNHVILALTEGRGNASCEIGMAVINTNRPSIVLCQLSDTQSYVNTLTKINILNPNEIIVPMTFIEGRFQSRLLEKIQQHFSDLKISGFARSAFNKANGLDRIRYLCLPQCDSVLLTLQHKYYCLSAASALLRYIENIKNVYYARETVKVAYEESEGSMIIDISAADKLELVALEGVAEPGKKGSLFAILNHCLTRIGTRTLRSTILQPPSSMSVIKARLDYVAQLINKPEMLAAIQSILMKLNNVDQLLSLATLLPEALENYSERQLNYILLLNLILDQIAPLKDIFEATEQQFLPELRETLNSERFANLKETLAETIKNDAYPTKGTNATMQRCFAIKPGVNSLLDAVRKTYSEILDEMREYVAELGRKYGMCLTLGNNNKKGFHMVLAMTPQQRRTLKKSDLPQEFTQICRMSGSFTMKTEILTTYSVRIEDATANILQISNGIIRGLMLEIRNHLDLFYKLVEGVAKLDVLQSLAEASSGNSYVRPHFSDYTEVLNAKHPMLDILCSKEPIANTIRASDEYNMHIITGPNGSGKSIYIRQVALIQIMAQVGSYVPATSATLRICDRLFTRISLEDNMECNISTFELELLEIKHFLTTMTKHSLVIIDELCRSTAVEEGTALAMAICEKILQTPAYIFFTTHYTTITKLQELYCNVKIWQMEAHVTGTDVTSTKLDLRYNLLAGCTSLKRYSIYLLAKMWPENIVKFIENVLEDITKNNTLQTITIDEGIDAKTKLVYEVKAELQLLKRRQQLTKAAINTILNKYQSQLQEFGVRIVPSNEARIPPQTLSASQISYNYVPNQTNNTDISYEQKRNFIEENPEHLNYLIPDVSLHEDSQLFHSQPRLNLSYLSSPCEPMQNSLNVSCSLGSQTNKFKPTPMRNIFDSNSPQFFVNANKKPSQNFFTNSQSEQPFSINNQQNTSAEFFVNPLTPMTPTVLPNRTIDNVSQNSSCASTNQSKFNLGLFEPEVRTSTPLQNFKPPLSIPSTSFSVKKSQKPQEVRGFFVDAQKPSQNVFTNLQNEESFFGNNPQNTSVEFFVNPPTPMYGQEAATLANKTIDSAPQSSSFASMNQSKFDLGLFRQDDRTSTPLQTFKTPLSDDYSISYSPLCASPGPSLFLARKPPKYLGVRTNNPPMSINVSMYEPLPSKTIDSAPQSPMDQSKFNLEFVDKEAGASTSLQHFKHNSPLCVTSGPSTSSSSFSTRKPQKRAKFIPPSRLTKRQIEEAFAEQNRKMMESSDSSKVSEYARQICSRPSVRQLQQSEYIASIRRTEEGVVVIPAKETKARERKRKFTFNMPYKKVFDTNLLSDGNEKKFMEFLANGKKGSDVDFTFMGEEENSE